MAFFFCYPPGAGGGMATKVLSEAGHSVAVVEAGPYFDPADPTTMTQLKKKE